MKKIKCEKCGITFQSKLINYDTVPENSKIVVKNCKEACPSCGHLNSIPDFDSSSNKKQKSINGVNYAIQDFQDHIGIGIGATNAFIQQLIGGFDRTCEYECLKKHLILMLCKYKAFYFVLSPKPLKIYRGFKVEEEDLLKSDTEYVNRGRYSYAPKELTKSFGRCHKPGNPVFYASFAQETIFSELNAGVGDLVIIGGWESKIEKQYRYYHLGVLDYYRKTRCLSLPLEDAGLYYKFLKNIELEVNNRLADKDDFGLLSMLIDAYLSDAFSKPAYSYTDYKLTSIVSDYLFENRDFDILGYPSVKHYGGTNYAIKPSIIDNDLLLNKVYLYFINNDLGFGMYGTKLISEINFPLDSTEIEIPIEEIKNKIEKEKSVLRQ